MLYLNHHNAYDHNKKVKHKISTQRQTLNHATCTSVSGGLSLLSLSLYNFSGPKVFNKLKIDENIFKTIHKLVLLLTCSE